jgi:hypothetical protein
MTDDQHLFRGLSPWDTAHTSGGKPKPNAHMGWEGRGIV